MYLLIDVGNTRIKWRLITTDYESSELSHYGTLEDLSNYIETISAENIHVLLSAVNQTQQLELLLARSHFECITIAKSQSSQAGINNSYQNPERMGVDRWLAMIAAYSSAQLGNEQLSGVIVVDAGSALTIDVVNARGEHEGGYIVPGLEMSQQALFTNTEQVIQYNDGAANNPHADLFKKLGNDTNECVKNGVINQMLALINQVKEEYSDYEIVFTGGDGDVLARTLKAGTVDRDLVLKGLWQVRK